MDVPAPDVAAGPTGSAPFPPPSRSQPSRVFASVYAAWGASLFTNQLYSVLAFVILSASSVGLLNWGTAAAALSFVVLDGGIDTASVIVAKGARYSLAQLTLTLGALRIGAASVALLVWGSASLLGLLHGREATVLLLAGVGFALRSLETPFSTSLLVRDRQAMVAFLGLVHSLLRIGSLVVVVATRRATPETILLAAIGADITLLVLAAAAARRDRQTGRHDRGIKPGGLVAGIVRAAPWVNATQILMVLQSRLDWLLVAGLVSYGALANYALANKGLEFIVLGGSVFGKLALPWFVEGWESRKLGPSLAAIVGLSIVAALVFAAAGTPFLTLVFGAKYRGSAPVIPIMASLAPGLMLLPILQYAAQAKGRSATAALASGAGLLGQIGVDLLLIPRLGIVGAAIGMCVFAATAIPLQLWFSARDAVIPTPAALRLGIASMIAPAVILALYLLFR
jgi:O-antigen/teichoic acid export membrane protein